MNKNTLNLWHKIFESMDSICLKLRQPIQSKKACICPPFNVLWSHHHRKTLSWLRDEKKHKHQVNQQTTIFLIPAGSSWVMLLVRLVGTASASALIRCVTKKDTCVTSGAALLWQLPLDDHRDARVTYISTPSDRLYFTHFRSALKGYKVDSDV